MDYAISFTRLANSQKLTDRYLTIQVLKPADPEKSAMGIIFALVEITNPWLPNSQIGQNIINTLAQEYFKKEGADALNNFENSLKKVNQNLAKYIEEGETNWVGNLNSIFALVINNEIHIAQTGKAEIFLFREKNTTRISENFNLKNDSNPLRTFIDITSGELISKDKFLIASSSILDYLSQKELHDMSTSGNTYESIEIIGQFLMKEKAKHINACAFEILSKGDLEKMPLQKNEVIYLDQVTNINVLGSFAKNLPGKIGPKIGNLNSGIKDTWDKTLFFFQNKVNPQAKSAWDKTKEISKKGYTHLSTKTAPQIKKAFTPLADKIGSNIKKQSELLKKINASKIETESSKNISNSMEIKKITEDEKPYSINYYEEKSVDSFNPPKKKLISGFLNISGKIKFFFKNTFSGKNYIAIYLVIVAILLSVLVASIIHLRSQQTTKKQEEVQNQMLLEANNKYEEAKLAILYNEPDKARDLLNDASALATNVLNSYPDFKDSALEIINKVNLEFDKLTITTRFDNPKEIVEFPQADKIFKIGDKLVSTNTKDNEIYFLSGNANSYSKTTPLNQEEGTYSAFVYDANSTLYALTDKNNLFTLNDIEIKPDKIFPSQGTWENASDMGFFLDNIYLLDSEEGQIYKHTKNNNNFSSGINYVDKDNIDLTNSISLTIDGNIYVLKSNNTIIKLNKGKQQDFSLNNIPEPLDKLSKGKKIWTNSEINSLYILDENRIIETDKDGKFLRQYAFSPDLQNIKDFVVDTNNKKMWILNDTKVFLVEY